MSRLEYCFHGFPRVLPHGNPRIEGAGTEVPRPVGPGSYGLRPAAWTYKIIMVKPMVYTATVNVHDILTCKHGTLLPTALDEDQYLESVEQDYMGVLLII